VSKCLVTIRRYQKISKIVRFHVIDIASNMTWFIWFVYYNTVMALTERCHSHRETIVYFFAIKSVYKTLSQYLFI